MNAAHAPATSPASPTFAKPDVLVASAARGRVGESPLWSASERVLWWVDIDGCALHRFDPATGLDAL